MMLRARWLFVALLSLSALLSINVSAQPQVSATILPLQLISAAITEGVSEPVLILGPEQSHHPVLRPSQRRALAEADLLLWIGSGMESTLNKVLTELDAAIMTAQDLAGVNTLVLRGGVDPHLWLDTSNARAIAVALVQQLSELDKENAAVYQNNLAAFERALEELNQQISDVIEALSQNNFAVYHNAFQYFEQQFGLQHVASFTDDEELQPGIRQLLAIKEELHNNEVSCLLVEPSTNIENLSNILDDSNMRYITVDVMGAGIAVNKEGYLKLMRAITNAISECLR